MSLDFESGKAPMQASTCDTRCSSLTETFVSFLEKIATEHVLFAAHTHKCLLFFSFFFTFFKFFNVYFEKERLLKHSKITSLESYPHLKPCQNALLIVGLPSSDLRSSEKAAIAQDVTSCSCFPAPLLCLQVKTSAVHSGLIPVPWFREFLPDMTIQAVGACPNLFEINVPTEAELAEQVACPLLNCPVHHSKH